MVEFEEIIEPTDEIEEVFKKIYQILLIFNLIDQTIKRKRKY